MTGTSRAYEPHPHIGGRNAALRALAAWRMEWPGAPRVVLLTGSPGTGRSWLLTGFLMLCDPEYRERLPLDSLDPATVPPELPAPAVPSPAGLTAAQLLWVLADHYGVRASRNADVYAELGSRDETFTIVVPDVDEAGPVRSAYEPARLVREVLHPLAALGNVRLLADVPRPLVAELVAALPPGTAQVIDLDEARWADPDGLALQAEALLDPAFGASDLPFTTDPAARRALAEALASRTGAGAGSRLTVRLAVNSILTRPAGFDPADPSLLPATVGEALDLHARRLGTDPADLRAMLAPLALAEGEGLPVELLGPLANAVAGHDMSEVIADGMLLAAPFIGPVEQEEQEISGRPAAGTADQDGEHGGHGGEGPGERTLLRLVHPGVGEAIRAGLPDVRAAQAEIAMALLRQVPAQDWSRADPYVRDHIAAHTLEAGLLPRLLTDPGLFTHADPVHLRAAVEAVPYEQLDAPARTYLRTAPLLTRSQAPVRSRAALLETAFAEDGLDQYADALHRIVPDLPWRTLWAVRLDGVSAVTVGRLPQPPSEATPGGAASEGEADGNAPAPLPVAVLVVPVGTPGSRPVGEAAETAVVVRPLTGTGPLDADPARIVLPSEDERGAAALAVSRGADYLRVWNRADERIVAALVSAEPFTGADISPDGVLLVATGSGAKAMRITPPAPAPPSSPAEEAAGAAGAAGS